MTVTITLDGQVEWTFDQASWRPLAYGAGSGISYLWSARAVIVLPTRPGADPDILEADEDLLVVFKVEGGWLLVCETSVRLVAGRQEASRVELGDVVEHAQWERGKIVVEDTRGVTTRIALQEGRLIC